MKKTNDINEKLAALDAPGKSLEDKSLLKNILIFSLFQEKKRKFAVEIWTFNQGCFAGFYARLRLHPKNMGG